LCSWADHRDDGSGGEELDKAAEEWLLVEVLVVTPSQVLGGDDELQADELEALLLEARDDLVDEATLHTIGLDGDEGALVVGADDSLRRQALALLRSGSGEGRGGSELESSSGGEEGGGGGQEETRGGGGEGLGAGGDGTSEGRANGRSHSRGGTREHDGKRESVGVDRLVENRSSFDVEIS
jgi:hypothetical protein